MRNYAHLFYFPSVEVMLFAREHSLRASQVQAVAHTHKKDLDNLGSARRVDEPSS